jgi:hypothetical protein
MTSNASTVYAEVSASFTSAVDYTIRSYVKLANITADAKVMSLLTSGNVELAYIKFNSTTDKFEFWDAVNNTKLNESAWTAVAGTFYRLEMVASSNAPTNNYVGVAFDADSVGSNMFVAQTTAPGKFRLLGDAANTVTHDDIAVNDSNGTAQNGSPGSGHVTHLRPVSQSAAGSGWQKPGGATTNLHTSLDNTPPVGIADTTAAGSAENQIRNATNAANSDLVLNMGAYTTAVVSGGGGMGSGDVLKLIRPIVFTGAPATTSPKTGMIQITSNPVGQITSGWNYLTLTSTLAGTFPTGWQFRAAGYDYSPSVTLGTSPQLTIRQITGSTRIAMVASAAVQIEWVEGSTPITGTADTATATEGTSSQEITGTRTDTGTLSEFARAAKPLLPENLSDDFSAGSFDSARWDNVFGTRSIVSGRGRMTTNAGYAQTGTNKRFLVPGMILSGEFLPPGGAITGNERELTLAVRVDSNNRLLFSQAEGTILAQVNTGGVANNTYNTYDPVAHRWWRIREVSGTVSFEVSPDGRTWTTYKTATTPAWATTEPVEVIILTGVYGTAASMGAQDYAEFDNINITPPVNVTDSVTFTEGASVVAIPASDSATATEAPAQVVVPVAPSTSNNYYTAMNNTSVSPWLYWRGNSFSGQLQDWYNSRHGTMVGSGYNFDDPPLVNNDVTNNGSLRMDNVEVQSPDLAQASTWAVEGWIKVDYVDGTINTYQRIYTTPNHYMDLAYGSFSPALASGSGTVGLNGPAIKAGKATHFVVRYDGTNLDLFIDGVKTNTLATTYAVPSGTSKFRLSAAYPVKGWMDEVAFYNGNYPTDADILAHYRAGAPQNTERFGIGERSALLTTTAIGATDSATATESSQLTVIHSRTDSAAFTDVVARPALGLVDDFSTDTGYWTDASSIMSRQNGRIEVTGMGGIGGFVAPGWSILESSLTFQMDPDTLDISGVGTSFYWYFGTYSFSNPFYNTGIAISCNINEAGTLSWSTYVSGAGYGLSPGTDRWFRMSVTGNTLTVESSPDGKSSWTTRTSVSLDGAQQVLLRRQSGIGMTYSQGGSPAYVSGAAWVDNINVIPTAVTDSASAADSSLLTAIAVFDLTDAASVTEGSTLLLISSSRTENLSLNDNVTLAAMAGVTDAFAATDQPATKAILIPIATSDSVSFSDATAATLMAAFARADSFSGTEQTVQMALAATETITASDVMLGLVYAMTAADAITGSDSSALLVAYSRTDSGTAADASNPVGASLSRIDNAGGTEAASSLSAAASASDSITATDVVAILKAMLAYDDAAAGVDAIGTKMSLLVADASTPTDATGSAQQVPLDDAASGSEVISPFLQSGLADAAGSVDTIEALSGLLTLADVASVADALSVALSASLADTGAVTDGFSVTRVSFAVLDVAEGSDLLDLTGLGIAVADTAEGLDDLAQKLGARLLDEGTGEDSTEQTPRPGIHDTATGSETLNFASQRLVEDTASALEGYLYAVTMTLDDTAEVTDSITFKSYALLGLPNTRRFTFQRPQPLQMRQQDYSLEIRSTNTARLALRQSGHTFIIRRTKDMS